MLKYELTSELTLCTLSNYLITLNVHFAVATLGLYSRNLSDEVMHQPKARCWIMLRERGGYSNCKIWCNLVITHLINTKHVTQYLPKSQNALHKYYNLFPRMKFFIYFF